MHSRYLLPFFALIFVMPNYVLAQNAEPKKKNKKAVRYKTLMVYDTAYIFDTLRIKHENSSPVLNLLPTKKSSQVLLSLGSQDRGLRNKVDSISPQGTLMPIERTKKANPLVSRFSNIRLNDFLDDAVQAARRRFDYGLSCGGGVWWAGSNLPDAKQFYVPSYHLGLFLEYKLRPWLLVQQRVCFQFMRNNYSYKIAIRQSIPTITLGENASTTHYQQVSLPLSLCFRFGNFYSSLGAEYSFRKALSFDYSKSLLGLQSSVGYCFRDRVSFGLKGYIAVTKDFDYSLNLQTEAAGGSSSPYHAYWKTRYIEVFMNYYFNKKEIKTATFRRKNINQYDNYLKLRKMKKIGFISLMLFGIHSAVLAQSDFGLAVGTGFWKATCNSLSNKSEIAPTYHLGLYYERKFGEHISVLTGLNYHFLMSNYSYKTSVTDTIGSYYFGDGESASRYTQISVPILVGYQMGSFKPQLGLEYSYRKSESWLNKTMNILAATARLEYRLGRRLSIGVLYSYGLTTDYCFQGDRLDFWTNMKKGEYRFNWKSSRYEAMLTYSFRDK